LSLVKTVMRSLLVSLVVIGLLLGALVGAVALGVRGYARLTHEEPVATLEFEAREPQRFLAIVTREGSREPQLFVLGGDDWQIDARVLKWRGIATLFGLDPRYRLERVSGRYRDIEQERREPRSVFALGEAGERFDLFSFALAHPAWVPFVDALYGSATYLPMADGARYQVTIGPSGLIARAQNTAAQAATQSWPSQ
jgi:hypothetical protein